MIQKITGFFSGIFLFIWVVLLALFLRWSVLEVYVIPIQGMMPTLFVNDHVIVNKMAYGLRTPFFFPVYFKMVSTKKRGCDCFSFSF